MVHSKTKLTPSEVMTGQNHSNHLLPIVDFQHPIVTASEYLATIRIAQQYYWDITKRNLVTAREKRDPEDFKRNPYNVGDFVLIKIMHPLKAGMKKATPKYEGPYRCLLYTSPSPRDLSTSRMPSSA